ncbi:MAG: small multi-drug export protein [Candidatus Saelkia tenebricola]|nr:small multi-drug export protein [Candidatus Saelkia tenebricola]
MENILRVILTAAMPVSELRGAIPLAIFGYKFSLPEAFLISVIGNLLPVPFLLLLFAPVAKKLRELFFLKKFFLWLENRTKKKARLIEKYEFLGLILFVAVPFPTTGAWTGSFAATIFKIRFRRAFLAITLGVIIAGIIVTLLSWGGILFLK